MDSGSQFPSLNAETLELCRRRCEGFSYKNTPEFIMPKRVIEQWRRARMDKKWITPGIRGVNRGHKRDFADEVSNEMLFLNKWKRYFKE